MQRRDGCDDCDRDQRGGDAAGVARVAGSGSLHAAPPIHRQP